MATEESVTIQEWIYEQSLRLSLSFTMNLKLHLKFPPETKQNKQQQQQQPSLLKNKITQGGGDSLYHDKVLMGKVEDLSFIFHIYMKKPGILVHC